MVHELLQQCNSVTLILCNSAMVQWCVAMQQCDNALCVIATVQQYNGATVQWCKSAMV